MGSVSIGATSIDSELTASIEDDIVVNSDHMFRPHHGGTLAIKCVWSDTYLDGLSNTLLATGSQPPGLAM